MCCVKRLIWVIGREGTGKTTFSNELFMYYKSIGIPVKLYSTLKNDIYSGAILLDCVQEQTPVIIHDTSGFSIKDFSFIADGGDGIDYLIEFIQRFKYKLIIIILVSRIRNDNIYIRNVINMFKDSAIIIVVMNMFPDVNDVYRINGDIKLIHLHNLKYNNRSSVVSQFDDLSVMIGLFENKNNSRTYPISCEIPMCVLFIKKIFTILINKISALWNKNK